MMENDEWLRERITDCIKMAGSFDERAFYRALLQNVTEQSQRIELLQGEIDGRTWSPEKW